MLKNVILSALVLLSVLTAVLCDRKQDVLFAEYGSFGSKGDFYSEEYLNGLQHTIETNGPCKNLPKSWQRRALSVDTKGTCLQGCDDTDCKGTCKYIYPNNGEQQLSQIGMARKVVSVQGCFQNRS